MPRTTRDEDNEPPMILTTRTLSTLNSLRLCVALEVEGRMSDTACATSGARISSWPYCFDAIDGRKANASDSGVGGLLNVAAESAVQECQCASYRSKQDNIHSNSARALSRAISYP